MNAIALDSHVPTSSTLSPSETTAPVSDPSATRDRAHTQFSEEEDIIIGSTLGGIALVLVCLAILLYPIWRRRHTQPSDAPKRTPSRLSKSCPSPGPRPSNVGMHMVRPVTPSPSRLAIDASAPSSTHPFGIVSTRWDVEKAHVHTPSGHPAIVWRGNIFGNENSVGPAPEVPQAEQSEPSISTTFAAEMSSILESISIKSSYSSLRSSGAVLGVPARLQTPLSVHKLRQDSCATSVGATRGSLSDGGGACSNSLSRAASTISPKGKDSKTEEK